MQSTSLRTPTRYEAERIEAMMKLGCVACAVLGIPYAEAQCHHILDGGTRMGHWFSIPVCAGHHKGEFTALQRRLLLEIAEERGIKENPLGAIHTGRKAFAKVYGTEKQLWTRVQERLRLPAVWPSSKILPRRGYVQVDVEATQDRDRGPGDVSPGGSDVEAPGQAATGAAV